MFSRIFHSKTVASISNWAGVAVVLSTGFAVLSKHSPKLFGELNWQEATLVGVASAAAFLLALALVMYLATLTYRTARPVVAVPPSPNGADAGKIPGAELEERVSVLEQQKGALSEAERNRLSEALTSLEDCLFNRHYPFVLSFERLYNYHSILEAQGPRPIAEALEAAVIEAVHRAEELRLIDSRYAAELQFASLDLKNLINITSGLETALRSAGATIARFPDDMREPSVINAIVNPVFQRVGDARNVGTGTLRASQAKRKSYMEGRS